MFLPMWSSSGYWARKLLSSFVVYVVNIEVPSMYMCACVGVLYSLLLYVGLCIEGTYILTTATTEDSSFLAQ
jgi:hypothetical protein